MASALAGPGHPALAECTSGGCYDGLVIMLASLLGYALTAIALLVMLARAKWRKAGLRALAVVLVLALGCCGCRRPGNPGNGPRWKGVRWRASRLHLPGGGCC